MLLLSLFTVALVVEAHSNPANLMASSTDAFYPQDVNITVPGHVPLDVGGYSIAPQGLTLEQVYLFVRHGTRHLCYSKHLLQYYPRRAHARR